MKLWSALSLENHFLFMACLCYGIGILTCFYELTPFLIQSIGIGFLFQYVGMVILIYNWFKKLTKL